MLYLYMSVLICKLLWMRYFLVSKADYALSPSFSISPSLRQIKEESEMWKTRQRELASDQTDYMLKSREERKHRLDHIHVCIHTHSTRTASVVRMTQSSTCSRGHVIQLLALRHGHNSCSGLGIIQPLYNFTASSSAVYVLPGMQCPVDMRVMGMCTRGN